MNTLFLTSIRTWFGPSLSALLLFITWIMSAGRASVINLTFSQQPQLIMPKWCALTKPVLGLLLNMSTLTPLTSTPLGTSTSKWAPGSRWDTSQTPISCPWIMLVLAALAMWPQMFDADSSFQRLSLALTPQPSFSTHWSRDTWIRQPVLPTLKQISLTRTSVTGINTFIKESVSLALTRFMIALPALISQKTSRYKSLARFATLDGS